MKIKKQMQKGLSLAIYRFTERERQQIADRERERERGEFSFGCCFYTSEMVCGGGIW